MVHFVESRSLSASQLFTGTRLLNVTIQQTFNQIEITVRHVATSEYSDADDASLVCLFFADEAQ